MIQTTILDINDTDPNFPETMNIDIRGSLDKRTRVDISGMTSGDTTTLSDFIGILSNTITHTEGVYSANTYVEIYVRSSNYPLISSFSGISDNIISTYSGGDQIKIDNFINLIENI